MTKWCKNFQRQWKNCLGFSHFTVNANETEPVYTLKSVYILIHNGNGFRFCHIRTDVIFFHIYNTMTILLLKDLCSCHSQVLLFIIFPLSTTRPSPHVLWLAQRLTLVKETILKKNFCVWQNYFFLVVLLTLFKRIETNLLTTLQFLVTDLNW